MTQDMQKNIDYLKSSFERIGFGDIYHTALEEGIKASLPSVPFQEAIFDGPNKEQIKFKPVVVEAADRPGFYVFSGLTATKSVEGKPDQTISVNQFKMTGMNLEQAKSVLNGGTVYHTDGQDSNGVAKNYYSKIDFSKQPKEDGTLPLIRVAGKSFDFLALISKERIVANPDEKKEIIAKLQSGEKVQVTLRPENYTGGQYPRAVLQVDLVPGKTEGTIELGLKVTDTSGKSLRVQKQEPKVAFDNQPKLRLRTVPTLTGAPQVATAMANAGETTPQRTTRQRRTT